MVEVPVVAGVLMPPAKYEDPERASDLEEAADILALTVLRDRANKLINFVAMLLAQTNEDMYNVGQDAAASTGKTYIGQELAAYFPATDVRTYAGASPTSFFHSLGESKLLVELEQEMDLSRVFDEDELRRERESNLEYQKQLLELQGSGRKATRDPRRRVIFINLKHKILIFLDQPHWQLMERLRPLLSHDQEILRFDITDKSGKGGLRTKTVVIIGYCVVIFATAKTTREEQEQTRMWLVSPETTQEKLKDSLRLLGKRIGDRAAFREWIENDPGRRWLRARIARIRNTGIRDVIIPDQEKILEKYLTERKYLAPRSSRDWPRLLYLIKGCALYNAFQRKRSGDSIFSSEEDNRFALSLYSEVAKSNELGLSPETYSIYETVLLPLTKDGTKVDRKAIQEKFVEVHHRLLAPDRLRRETLPALESAGLIGQEPDPTDRRRTLVWCTVPTPIIGLNPLVRTGGQNGEEGANNRRSNGAPLNDKSVEAGNRGVNSAPPTSAALVNEQATFLLELSRDNPVVTPIGQLPDGETSKSDNPKSINRIDIPLVKDFLLRTVFPTLEQRIGYSTLPQVTYFCQDRFGEEVKTLISPLLVSLEKDGLIFQSRPRCYKRTLSSPIPSAEVARG